MAATPPTTIVTLKLLFAVCDFSNALFKANRSDQAVRKSFRADGGFQVSSALLLLLRCGNFISVSASYIDVN